MNCSRQKKGGSEDAASPALASWLESRVLAHQRFRLRVQRYVPWYCNLPLAPRNWRWEVTCTGPLSGELWPRKSQVSDASKAWKSTFGTCSARSSNVYHNSQGLCMHCHIAIRMSLQSQGSLRPHDVQFVQRHCSNTPACLWVAMNVTASKYDLLPLCSHMSL